MSIRRVICQSAVLCSVFALLAACAGPRAGVASAPAAARVAADAPPALIAGDPKVAGVTARLAAATDTQRPAVLLERVRVTMAAAQALRWSKMKQWDLISPEDEVKYVAYYKLAIADCEKVLERMPAGPEAPEAQFMIAEIHDYPHLAEFQAADQGYSRTIERYPGTPAAQKATAALQRIREHLGSPALPPPPQP